MAPESHEIRADRLVALGDLSHAVLVAEFRAVERRQFEKVAEGLEQILARVTVGDVTADRALWLAIEGLKIRIKEMAS